MKKNNLKCIFVALLFILILSPLNPVIVKAIVPEVYTYYQTGSDYDSRQQLPTDGVSVHSLNPGYQNFILNYPGSVYTKMGEMASTHDYFNIYTSGAYDGTPHPEIIQKHQDGSLETFNGVASMVTPTAGWNNYLKSVIDNFITRGVKYISNEELQMFNTGGYDDAFKSEWLSYYGTAWVDPNSSEDAFMKSSKLRNYLLQRQLNQVFGYTKTTYPDTKTYLHLHSLLSNTYMPWPNPVGIVEAMSNANVDGVFGQVWSNTINTPVLYEGSNIPMPFENAYTDYSYFGKLGNAFPSKDIGVIADPKGDSFSTGEGDPKSWEWLKDEYIHQIVSQFMFSNIYRYNTAIWPSRIVGMEANEAPEDFKTVMSNIISLQGKMHNYTTDITTGNKPIRVGLLMSDTTSWQVTGPNNTTDANRIYSLNLPLLHRGLLVDSIPLEGITTAANILNNYDLILLSFDGMKPQSSTYLDKIRDWINAGGIAVYVGGKSAYENISSMWWRPTYASPQDYLMAQLGASLTGRNTAVTATSLSPEAGSTLATAIGTISSTSGYNMIGYTGGNVTPMYKSGSNIVSFQKDYGSGKFVYFGMDPLYFGSSATGSSKIFNIIQNISSLYKSVTLTAKNYIDFTRGPFKGIFSINGTYSTTGKYVDMFDENLPVITSKSVDQGKGALLYDVSGISVTTTPKVLFAQGNNPTITETTTSTQVVTKGATGTLGTVRILGKNGLYPTSATALSSSGKDLLYSSQWDDTSKSYLVKYWNSKDSVTINVGWTTSGNMDMKQAQTTIVDDRDAPISYNGTWYTMNEFTHIDDRNTGVNYTGTWSNISDNLAYSGTEKQSVTSGNYVQYSFSGSSIAVYGSRDIDHGIAKIYIDNVLKATVDTYSAVKMNGVDLYGIHNLSRGIHTIKIEVTNTKNASSSGYKINIDRFYGYEGLYLGKETTSKTTNDYTTLNFVGNSVRWIGTSGPDGGKANVYIDGVLDQSNIDSYSAASGYRTIFYSKSGLSNGSHSIKIVVNGTKNASSSDYNVSVDKIEYTTNNYAVDDKSSSITYSGTWINSDTTSANYHGTEKNNSTTGAYAEYTFTGDTVKWIGQRNSSLGIAKVYIDGVLYATVDTYSPASQYQQVLLSATGLSIGSHIIKVEVTGTKNASSSSNKIIIDKFESGLAMPLPYINYINTDDKNSSLTYSGTWNNYDSDSENYNGTEKYTDVAASFVQFTFKGDAVSWIGTRQNSLGIAKVYIDGVWFATIDQYGPTTLHQQTLFSASGLSNGSHTIKVEVTGTRNPSSTGNNIVIDKFESGLSIPHPYYISVDDKNSSLTYSGTWNNYDSDSENYNGTEKYTDVAASFVQFTFKGDAVSWIGTRQNSLGIAKIYIDGVWFATIDQYGPNNLYQQTLFSASGLSNGSHTIKVEVTGTRNPSSTGNNIVIDKLEYSSSNAAVDDTDVSLTYSGTWYPGGNTADYNQTLQYSGTTGNYVQYTFTGSQVNFVGSKNNNLGFVNVYIDGNLKATIDMYNASYVGQYSFYSLKDLDYGSHTIKISVNGTKNASSSGYYVSLDKFEYR